MSKARYLGFTVAELLVATAVFLVLLLVGIPSYVSHLTKAQFSSTVQAAGHMQFFVAKCIKERSSVAECDSGKHGIPARIEPADNMPGRYVVNGTIFMTAPTNARHGVAGITYMLRPVVENDAITWVKTGTACRLGYVSC